MNKSNPLRVGNNVFVRTVTHYYTGRVLDFDTRTLLLEGAAWVAETDRWADTLRTGKLREVEPFPEGVVYVAMGAVVDICDWSHPLPRGQK